MNRLLLWSNMYPTAKAPYYGTFVRSTKNAWEKKLGKNNVWLVAIKDKPTGRLNKIYLYIELMCRCFLSLFKVPKKSLLEIHYPVYFLPVLCIAKLLGRKNYLVLRFHGSDLKKTVDSRFFSFLFNRLKKDIDLYVVPSDYYRNKLSQSLGVPMNKVIKVYPDCVGEEFLGNKQEKAEESKEPSTSHECFNIGFVSRLEPMKNCQELLEAFSRLEIPEAKLTIVGDGSQRRYLEQIAESLNISSRVHFLGPIARERLPDVMETFSVFVFPSVSETESFGLVGLEALACGVPILANDQLEAVSEYLSDGQNGFFYGGGAEGLAKSIETYYQLPSASRVELARQARAVQSRFDYHHVFSLGVNEILTHYHSDTLI